MASLPSASPAALTQLSARSTLPLVSQVAIKLAYACLLWSHRSRSRAALRTLSDTALYDIGLSRAEARREYTKWFWRP